MAKLSDTDKVKAIEKIVENTDEHRNRAKRESWDAVKAILAGEPEPVPEVVVEPEPEPVASYDELQPARRGPGRPKGS